MTFSLIASIVIVCLTIYGLVRRYETRLVLISSGLLMAILSLDPMTALQQFDKSMTNASLIIAICSAMGFAAVVSLTKCDVHLVALLMKPLGRLGIFLLPASMCVTGICAVAIPSTAGLCAAVGPTIIPLLIRAGFRPAIAAAAVVCATTPALYNPGVAHNVFVAKLADIGVMDLLGLFSLKLLVFSAAIIAGLTIVCLLYRDFRKANAADSGEETHLADNLPKKVNLAYAFAPLLPVLMLIGFTLWTDVRIGVATAMLTGAIYALAVTRTSPAEATKKFFDGMGKGYANILGIIIAAGVFAAGLRAAGVVDLLVGALTSANEWARIGGSFGPYIMGVMTGSGDAAAFAFNEAVTPHAAEFGMTIPSLGYLATVAGSFGRLSSPLCGGLILVAGIAQVNPMDIVKRSFPVMFVMLLAAYFFI